MQKIVRTIQIGQLQGQIQSFQFFFLLSCLSEVLNGIYDSLSLTEGHIQVAGHRGLVRRDSAVDKFADSVSDKGPGCYCRETKKGGNTMRGSHGLQIICGRALKLVIIKSELMSIYFGYLMIRTEWSETDRDKSSFHYIYKLGDHLAK